jgi:uncharacterized protein (DUF934 family)
MRSTVPLQKPPEENAMTKIWNRDGFVENDPWVIETEEVKATAEQKPVLPLADFLVRAAESNDIGLGVLITPADDVTRLGPYLDRIDLVAVSFPAFNDGRGFSHASLLRSRLGFVLIDQVPLMLRTGFTSFAVTNGTAIRRLSENRLPEIPVYYQPTAKPASGGEAYSWRRRASL